MQQVETEVTTLAVIEPKDIQTVFTTPGSLDPILQKIAAEARSFVADTSTATGRKSIASVAFKVAKTKTYLDGLGKELVDGLKDLPRKVDANRKSARDFLDALKDEVRKPLTDWELEQERIEAELKAAEEAAALAVKIEQDHEFAILLNAEFDRKAKEALEAAELARKQELERIAQQAAENARLEAEAKAKAEQEASLRRELEAKMQAERAEREKQEAEKRARDAEEREIRAAQAAAEREERAKEEAVKAEQERVAAQERKVKEEQEKREANARHCKKINSETANDLMEALGLEQGTAEEIVGAIASGKIRHAAITY